jgi:Zn-dependent metalloprotease
MKVTTLRSLGILVAVATTMQLTAQTPTLKPHVKKTASTTIHTAENLAPLKRVKNAVPLAPVNPLFASSLQEFKGLPKMVRPVSPAFQTMRDADGRIVMATGILQKSNGQPMDVQIQDYLQELASALEIRDPKQEFTLQRSETDELGQTHIRLQQVFNTIPIYGAEVILHASQGQINVFNGTSYATPTLKSVTPSLNSSSALDNAQADLRAKNIKVRSLTSKEQQFITKTTPRLVIYMQDKKAFLVWHITVYPNIMNRYEYFVDAQTGAVINSYDHSCNLMAGTKVGEHTHCAETRNSKLETSNSKLETSKLETRNLPPLDGPATANALDLFNVSQKINTYQVNGIYYLVDATRTMFNAAGSKLPDNPIGAIWTVDALNQYPTGNFEFDHVKSNNNSWNNPKAVSAHTNAVKAYEYFRTTHARNSINGTGGTVTSFIRVADENGGGMDNAFWNGEAMFYGDGDKAFSPLAKALDVAGHEISHGVVQNTANLEYQGESGAMNESFADIFGAMIDRDDWRMGEDVVKTAYFPTGCLRNLSDPNNGGTSINDAGKGWQPSKVSQQYKGTQDNGGVHINSGITNFAYYKIATSITKDKAEKIFYRALSKYLVKSSKFIDLRAAAVQAATDLYSAAGAEVAAVNTAFNEAGIGSGGTTTGDNYQNDVKKNPGNDVIAVADQDFSALYLANAAGDIIANPLTSTPVAGSRMSAADDGSYVIYVGKDKKIYYTTIDWVTGTLEQGVLSDQAIWRSVAMSKDGNRVAALMDNFSDSIFIYDYNISTTTWKKFVLKNPTYSTGISTGDVNYADEIEWDLTSQYILYDASNTIKGVGNSDIEYWDIGVINIFDTKANKFADGKVQKLFTDLPEGANVGNPTFAKNSPYIIAYDYIDASGIYAVAANIETGDIGVLYKQPISTTYTYPNFSNADDKIIVQTTDGKDSYVGTIDLDKDKINAKKNAPFVPLLKGAIRPVWFANGKRNLNVPTQDIENALNSFVLAPNPSNGNVKIMLQLTNATTLHVEIMDILGKNILRQTTEGNLGQNTLSFDLNYLPTGTYLVKVNGMVKKLIME